MDTCRQISYRAAYEKFGDGDSFNTEAQRRRVDVPFDLPQGWAWCRWKNISLSIQYGYNAPALPKGRIQMVRISDIQEGRIQWEKVPYCEIQESDIGKYLLAPGDILFARTGGTVGKSYLVDDIPHESIYAGYLVRTKSSSMVFPKYTKVFLESNCYWQQLRSGVIATAQPNFNGEKLASMLVPLPPLTEQRRIVAKIEELFAVVDSLGEAADNLESDAKRLDKKILDLAIRGKLVPQDPDDEPASELVKRIAASHKSPCKNQSEPIDPPFEIPDSWEWVRLGLLVQVISGVSYSKGDITESGIRILRGGNLNGNAELTFYDDDVFISPNYYDNDNEIQCGDIVIVASTGSSKVIGRPAIATHDMSGVQIGAFLRIVRAHEREFSKWIATLFCSNYYRTHIRKMSKGTNIKNLKAEYITGFAIPLPPLAEQKRIVAKIEELRAVIKPLTM